MKRKTRIHNRRSIRLKEYDYARPGEYFITICARGRECIFGEIVDGEMRLSQFGNIVRDTWNDLPNHNRGIELDAFVVMPNHIHGIIIICDNDVGADSESAYGQTTWIDGNSTAIKNILIVTNKQNAEHRRQPGLAEKLL